jgi:serine/threonine-protein kinase
MTSAPLVSPTPVAVGDVLDGRYRIAGLLAVGGMGSVFLAEHLLIKRRLAIKVLHPELASNRTNVSRFMNEALAAGTLGHPNIVEATDMGFVHELPFIVFEYLEGSVLTEEIYRVRGLGVRRALDIAIQIASALDAAHAAGIIHLDLKCDNVILTDRSGTSDHVKVLDFGISKFASSDVDRTNPAVVAGTPEFMAPEQITAPDAVDARTDVYALGVCLYEMLAARAPFCGEDARVLLHRVVHELPTELPPSIPEELRRLIVDRMLAKDPSDRFDNMEQVSDALKKIALEFRPTSTSGAVTPPPQRTGRRKRAFAGPAVVVLVAAAVGAWSLQANRSTTPGAVKHTSVAKSAPATPRVDASRVQAAIDLAKQRAQSIAMSPMLRAAIATDAATMQDLLRSEPTFALTSGETMELHQGHEKTSALLARVPNDARPVGLGPTRLDLRARPVHVVVTAPVRDRDSHDAGSLVLAVTLPDLGPDEVAQTIDALRVADPTIEVMK